MPAWPAYPATRPFYQTNVATEASPRPSRTSSGSRVLATSPVNPPGLLGKTGTYLGCRSRSHALANPPGSWVADASPRARRSPGLRQELDRLISWRAPPPHLTQESRRPAPYPHTAVPSADPLISVGSRRNAVQTA